MEPTYALVQRCRLDLSLLSLSHIVGIGLWLLASFERGDLDLEIGQRRRIARALDIDDECDLLIPYREIIERELRSQGWTLPQTT